MTCFSFALSLLMNIWAMRSLPRIRIGVGRTMRRAADAQARESVATSMPCRKGSARHSGASALQIRRGIDVQQRQPIGVEGTPGRGRKLEHAELVEEALERPTATL